MARAADGRRSDVENPSRRERLATVARANAEDVDHAVSRRAARRPAWQPAARDRGLLLLRIADDRYRRGAGAAHRRGDRERNPHPGPRRGGHRCRRVSLLRAARASRSARCSRSATECSATASASRWALAAIVPWNAPASCVPEDRHGALHRQHARAQGGRGRTAGVLRLAEVCAQHLPDGVLNVLTGYGEECGGPLLNHPGIAKITFTAPPRSGRSRCARRGRTHPAGVAGTRRQGAGDRLPGLRRRRRRRPRHHRDALRPPGPIVHRYWRLYVHESIFDELHGEARRQARRDGRRRRARRALDIGSVVSGTQDARVRVRARGARPGARAVAGGLPDDGRPGYQHQPTVLTGVEQSWRVSREEVFDPCSWRCRGATKRR